MATVIQQTIGRRAQPALLHLRADDDVAIATWAFAAGTSVTLSDGGEIDLVSDVPSGHKVAVRDLAAGSLVHKYGHVIGATTATVRPGEHVHSHNLAMPANPTALATVGEAHPAPATVPADLRRTFEGYVRADGRVGTRNDIVVLTTVNCSATVAKAVARRTGPQVEAMGDGVDEVVAITHGTGCGMAGSGEGWQVLRRTLAGYARNPNVGGLVVIGLGCEVNTLDGLLGELALSPEVPVSHLSIQSAGGTAPAIAQASEAVLAMARALATAERRTVGVEQLVLGLQCGGSDAWSALTANPALGVASDYLVQLGGTSLLGETPEIYGAEQMLVDRVVDPADGERILERIRWWERYTAAAGTTLDGNPSPGNKAGGITTILEKSLGSVAKGGQSPVAGYVEYAEPCDGRPGLLFMDTPGFDPVSATGMVAGGATLICFTTGRGSAFGSKPAPTVKLATNAAVATHMSGDMDLDCSGVADQGVPVEVMGRRVYEMLLDVASGAPTKSELLGLGDEEFVPWQIGAVL
ncbi:MAG: UxaA family hydrolase [Dermatophilaceae bacterium]